MKDLLSNYSLDQIVMFIVLLAAAIKGVISWYEWAKGKIKHKYDTASEKEKIDKEMREDIDNLNENMIKLCDKVDKITDTVNLLVESDKDDIKAWITREHHYFCYTLGCIDDYNLDCIERRYAHYKEEGGNSFTEDLMGEIRMLPKKTIEVTPSEITSKMIIERNKSNIKENK